MIAVMDVVVMIMMMMMSGEEKLWVPDIVIELTIVMSLN